MEHWREKPFETVLFVGRPRPLPEYRGNCNPNCASEPDQLRGQHDGYADARGAGGDSAFPASIANQMAFMFMVISFGVANGCNVLSAQHWGKGNIGEIKKIISFMFRVVFFF